MKTDLSFIDKLGKIKEKLKPQPDNPVFEVLTAFVTIKISEAKKNLRDANDSSSGTLEQSIRPEPEITKSGILIKVMAEDYFDYLNKGVNGLERRYGAPYSFKSLAVGSGMLRSFEDFIKHRNIKSIAYQNKEGETIEKILSNASDYKSASYVLARATKKKGIRANHFMDKAFDDESIEELTKSLGLAVKRLFE